MRELATQDPAELVVAWEAVEELLSVVPEGRTKMILRMLAAGISVEEIADAVGLSPEEIDVLVARARIRVLTASIRDRGAPPRR